MNKKQALKEVKELITSIDELYNIGIHSPDFNHWYYKILNFFENSYGTNSSKINQFKKINWRPSGLTNTNHMSINAGIMRERNVAFNDGLNATLGLLLATQEEISKFNVISFLNQQTGINENNSNYSNINETWQQINVEFGISKLTFAKKIKFIEKNTRKLIYRDIAHAYFLSKKGFNKSAIILAGSIIEELLRNFLINNDIKPRSNRFDDYIKQCEENGLLKEVIGKLSHSVRIFRNFVHIQRELESLKLISKPTAIGAVSNIFTIVNDFK